MMEKILNSDVENQKKTENKTNLTIHKMVSNDYYTKVEMPFSRLITDIFEGSDTNDLIQRMLAHIKTQVENPQMPESGFTLDKIMHLYINFHRLALTRSSFYSELPGWIQNKHVVLNSQNEDKGCFKWTVIAALHEEEIKKLHQRMSKLEPYENQYNWEGLEFPVLIKMIDKLEKNNPDTAGNMLFSNKKSQKKNVYTVHWSGRNMKCK